MLAYVTVHLACLAIFLELAVGAPYWPDEWTASPCD